VNYFVLDELTKTPPTEALWFKIRNDH